jgi:adenosine/AMP kinase
MALTLRSVVLQKPDSVNLILVQAHFIKTVEDLHEALVTEVPGIQFGLAFCEASGPCLVRWRGTDEAFALVRIHASAIGAGHSVIVLLKECFPINVLPMIRQVPEVCTIFCATANDVEVIMAEMERGCGLLGVVDGSSPKGVGEEQDIAGGRTLLCRFGYKF